MLWCRKNKHLLIISYLEETKQFVSFKEYESTCEKIEVGVPERLSVKAVVIPNTYK